MSSKGEQAVPLPTTDEELFNVPLMWFNEDCYMTPYLSYAYIDILDRCLKNTKGGSHETADY